VHHRLYHPCIAPCVGHHSGNGNDGGSGSSDSNARSHIAKAGYLMAMYDSDKVGVYAANNAGTSVTVEELPVMGADLPC